ncbi:MAG: UDP-glucose/GDP-mannose dehydrogenase family protein [Bacteroidota bacterium]
MKVIVVGTGYVGLVTGACLAEVGIHTTCVDIDETKIANLRHGVLPIYEPGLEDIVKRNADKRRLHFTTQLRSVISGADVIFIAVGTPPDEDGSADLKHVLNVASDIGDNIDQYTVVVTKSTVPVGTARKVQNKIQERLNLREVEIPIDIVSNPEFLKEGAAVADFLKPDRIVVGVESNKAKEMMSKLYKPFTLNGHPVVFMDIPSAEMTKYAANAMLATKISFINDIANLCELVGANVNLVRKGIGSDSRIGNKFIYPGVGYGGSCFPKDVKALIKTATEHKYEMKVLQAVEDVNERQKHVLFNKMKRHFSLGGLSGKKVAIWGLSFKPETDDMREAPSLTLINSLLATRCDVHAYDPVATEEAKRILGDDITYGRDQYEVLIDADCLLIVTEWSEFKFPNYKVMTKLMKEKMVFDGRNILDLEEMNKHGFYYNSIGTNSFRTNSQLEILEIA